MEHELSKLYQKSLELYTDSELQEMLTWANDERIEWIKFSNKLLAEKRRRKRCACGLDLSTGEPLDKQE